MMHFSCNDSELTGLSFLQCRRRDMYTAQVETKFIPGTYCADQSDTAIYSVGKSKEVPEPSRQETKKFLATLWTTTAKFLRFTARQGRQQPGRSECLYMNS